jgi:DNA-dependent RNA polymerase auxiliary subunit epsilon
MKEYDLCFSIFVKEKKESGWGREKTAVFHIEAETTETAHIVAEKLGKVLECENFIVASPVT